MHEVREPQTAASPAAHPDPLPTPCTLFGAIKVHPVTLDQAVQQICTWAESRESQVVCTANVHMVMEAHDNDTVRKALAQADLITPDGMPVAWLMRKLGYSDQPRVSGPDLLPAVCSKAAELGLEIGLYGSTWEVLDILSEKLTAKYPALRISYKHSPPFRALTTDEQSVLLQDITSSGTRILFVALGCPKQECWMIDQKGKIKAVMLGVGAAFEMHAGIVPRAPLWMQNAGLEWLYRLVKEPRRLWRRYFAHNPRFVALALCEVARARVRSRFEGNRPKASAL